MPTLYLIDGHAQFFRAYHAIRSGLASPVTKEPTNLTFGFTGMLLKVMREYKPDYLAVVIDAAGDRETFRSEIFPEYKATRKEPPEDFHPQVERALKILEQMGIPVVGVPGVEADDAIATIVRKLQRERPDLHIRIVSKDKDLAQLLNHNVPGVELFDVHKDQAVTAAEVFETPGLEPKHVVEVLTLMGDTIDNVPGVPGVGPKTAGQLIMQYGTVENLLAHLDEIKGKRRENLEAAKDKLPLSRQLVELKDDVELSFNLESAVCCPKDLPVEVLLATFRELGFGRFQDELKTLVGGREMEGRDPPTDGGQAATSRVEASPKSGAATMAHSPREVEGLFSESLFVSGDAKPRAALEGDYRCVKTIAVLDDLIEQLKSAGEFALDTETTGLSPLNDELCGLSVSFQPKTGYYIPARSCEQSSHLDTSMIIERLRPILEDPNVKKIGHNLKFDLNVLRRHRVRLRGHVFDTMIASYVIDATRSSHRMDVLALALLNYTCIPIADLIGTGKRQRSFDSVALDRATCYAAEDADITLRLRDCMAPQLRQMGLERLFHEVEMPLVDVLAELEWNGIRVDPGELDRQREQLEKRVDDLRRQIQDQAPFPFNPDSTKQLAQVLFNKPTADPAGLGLRSFRRGKTGPSTDQEVLDRLANDPDIESPIPRLIVEYRQLTKLVSTYLLALKEAINARTGRIHSSFNQTVAATGRLSSNDPNLQNIPIRTDVGREIRRAFVAEKSQDNWLNAVPLSLKGRGELDEPNALITADYSQIELRLLAHLSNDPALIDAFHQGLDIHTAVAAQVFGVQPEDVNATQRNSAKMVNFGIVYGITPMGLARRLRMAGTDTTEVEARTIITDYKNRFQGIAAFLERCINQAVNHGYVETILERRRAIPQVQARDPQQRALGERLAINSVVQGSAADLIKVAMIDIHRCLKEAHAQGATPTDCPPGGPWASASDRASFTSVRMVLQIHDELVFEAPRSRAEAVAAFVKQRMQSAMQLKVPLVVETAWSENWIDAK